MLTDLKATALAAALTAVWFAVFFFIVYSVLMLTQLGYEWLKAIGGPCG